ncbi:MAG: hypothetical protein FJ267_05920 [Planctomycetes bacterium]|nr:hypothetical protein [Planctomycetota bacterium]
MPEQHEPTRSGSQPVYTGRPGDSTPRRVLEDVIRQTASLYSLELSSDPADLEPLLAVAAKFQGMELQLEPILTELVKAALRRQMKTAWQSEEQFNKVAERVAQTFFENPETLERIRALWSRLSAGSKPTESMSAGSK